MDRAIRQAVKDASKKEAEKIATTKTALKGKHSVKMRNDAYKDAYNAHLKLLKDPKSKEYQRLEGAVAKDIHFIVTHQHHKVKNTHLLDRGPLLDPYMTVETSSGRTKVIQVYESNLSRTIEPYVMGMSKYLATLRYFPEYTGLGGKYKLGSSKVKQMKLRIEKNSLGEYADLAIQRLLGINEGHKLMAEDMTMLQGFAHFSAAAGLSSPTSGIKNLLIGIPRNIASYGFYNSARGMIKLFNHDAWNDARRKGALQYGSKTLELGQTPGRSMELLFKGNLMTFTENVNRIVGMEAGKLYFMDMLNVAKGQANVFGAYGKKNAERAMKDIWKLSKEDIDFLIKTEYFESKAEKERFDALLGQVEHYSHVSTQGGTSLGQLPLWMSSSIGKPLTLFQRMAYSTTWDSYRNYYRPIVTHGNVMPMARALFAHTLSGAALYGMHKWLFAQESPESAGDEVDKAFYYLWKSEFLGLGGWLMDPYDQGMFKNMMYPVVVRNLHEGGKAFFNWTGGKRDFLTAANDWAKQTAVIYGQADKMIKNEKNPQWTEARKWNTRRKQFQDEMGIVRPQHFQLTQQTFYYKDLKEALYFSDKEKTVNAFFAAYNTNLALSLIHI